MNHNIGCRKDQTQYEVPQVMAGGHSAPSLIVKHDGSCTCGLEALQSRVAELEAQVLKLSKELREANEMILFWEREP